MLERVPPPRADKGRLFVRRRARGGSIAIVRPNGHGMGFERHVSCDNQFVSVDSLLSHLLDNRLEEIWSLAMAQT
jgi:hypothetical protein